MYETYENETLSDNQMLGKTASDIARSTFLCLVSGSLAVISVLPTALAWAEQHSELSAETSEENTVPESLRYTLRFTSGSSDVNFTDVELVFDEKAPVSYEIPENNFQHGNDVFVGWKLPKKDDGQLPELILAPGTRLDNLVYIESQEDGNENIRHDLADYAEDGVILLSALWESAQYETSSAETVGSDEPSSTSNEPQETTGSSNADEVGETDPMEEQSSVEQGEDDRVDADGSESGTENPDITEPPSLEATIPGSVRSVISRSFAKGGFQEGTATTLGVKSSPSTRGTGYVIKFRAPGCAGEMNDATVSPTESYIIPACSFTREDCKFTGWLGSDGKTYQPEDEIPAETFATGDELLLTATWTQEEHSESDENLHFMVPSCITYAIKADGTIRVPDNISIQNASDMPIEISSIEVSASAGWNVVESISDTNPVNSISVNIGPEEHMLNLADYTGGGRTPLENQNWKIASGDSLELKTSASLANVTANLTNNHEIAAVQWYVKAAADTETVAYKANGGIGDDVIVPISLDETVASCSFTAPTGQTFDCWNTEKDGSGTSYAPGDSFSTLENITLYAQWK